ncbi:L-histidine N(alpha)-methyltransferase, partial [Salmonella enterica]|uniref:L-histidine N(alpha)-methyltransferase n=1 Tax=Salmonella enterica TaxID=28901 RepID=UPI003298C827
GNFEPDEALVFLIRLRKLLQGGGLLIGVDLVKDPTRLHAAYNDAAGATAAFNRNVLVRANRELGADFRPEQFAHYA